MLCAAQDQHKLTRSTTGTNVKFLKELYLHSKEPCIYTYNVKQFSWILCTLPNQRAPHAEHGARTDSDTDIDTYTDMHTDTDIDTGTDIDTDIDIDTKTETQAQT